jgi:hypothetical protein
MPSSITEKAFWFGLGAAATYALLRQLDLNAPTMRLLEAPVGHADEEYAALSEDINNLRDQIQWQYQGLISEQEGHFRQTQALLSLYHQIEFNRPLPPMREWTIGPDFANLVVTSLRERQPLLVLDAGGGLSTLLAAYCLEEQGVGRVVSLEHEVSASQATLALVTQHDLERYTDCLYAKLQPINPQQPKWIWYDLAALDGLHKIDFVILNVPTGSSNLVRDAALPILYPLLSDNAIILMDGVQRQDEKYLVEDWVEEFHLELLASYETEKGAAILQKNA